MRTKFCSVIKAAVLTFIVLCAIPSYGEDGVMVLGSDLDKRSFKKNWIIESESPDYKVSFLGDTVEIKAPKGLTLWRNQKLKAPLTIEYDAMVVVENADDRLSDLNCFWMASDPSSPDNFWKNSKGRGKFLNCYGMRLYYLGYGGNGNSTTRFLGMMAMREELKTLPIALKSLRNIPRNLIYWKPTNGITLK